MSDKATRLRRFLDGDIDASAVKDDPLLASLASRIYGVEAEDFEELPLVDEVVATPGVDLGDSQPPEPGDLPQGLPLPVSLPEPSPHPTAARSKLSRSAAKKRLQGTFPVYFGLLLLVLTTCNLFGLFGGVIGDVCQGDLNYCPPNQNKIAVLSIGEIDTPQGWADELSVGLPDIAMVLGSISTIFYGMSLRNRGRRLLEFKTVADIIAEDGLVTKDEAIELRDAASRLGISDSQHVAIAQELQSMADDGVDLLPGFDAATVAQVPTTPKPDSAPLMTDLPPPLPSIDDIGDEPTEITEEVAEVVPEQVSSGQLEALSDGEQDGQSLPKSEAENQLPSSEDESGHSASGEDQPPPIPPGGLPPGWTEEQWKYYGQQYVDSQNEDFVPNDSSQPNSGSQ